MQLGIVGGEPIGSALVPQQGFSPVGAPAPGGWTTGPSQISAVAAQITVSQTGQLDWSKYGVFQYLLTASKAFAPTFVNCAVGQTIVMLLQQPSSGAGTLTLPSGTILAGTAAATITLGCASTVNGIDCIQITCTAPGVWLAVQN